MKKELLLFGLLIFLTGCGNTQNKQTTIASSEEIISEDTTEEEVSDDKENTYDDKAIEAIEESLNKRWGKIETNPDASYSELVNIELGVLNKHDFDKEIFSDSELKQKVIKYVDCINRSKETIDLYNKDILAFGIQWNEIYVERIKILLELHDNYELDVKEEYQHNFDELSQNILDTDKEIEKCKKLDEMIKNLKFERTSDEWGYSEYTAVIENNSDFGIDYLNLEVTLLDEEGIVTDTYYPSVSNLLSGDKGKLSFSANSTTDNLRIVVSSYGFN